VACFVRDASGIISTEAGSSIPCHLLKIIIIIIIINFNYYYLIYKAPYSQRPRGHGRQV